MKKIGSIHVSIEGRMPPKLEHRVKTRAQARAFCRGFLAHCEDIMHEASGSVEHTLAHLEEWHDAVDMGNDVAQRLYHLDGGVPEAWEGAVFASQMDRWNGEA